jgi:hypothetical protein
MSKECKIPDLPIFENKQPLLEILGAEAVGCHRAPHGATIEGTN